MFRELIVGKSLVYADHFLSIPEDLRPRHNVLLGRTGSGKSALLHHLVQQEAERDYAVVVFDAGDLALSLLETFDDETLKRVRFFSPDYPIAYNPVLRRLDEPGRLENELTSLLDQVTAELSSTGSLTARMKRVLSVGIRETLKLPAPTLSDLTLYLLEHRADIRKKLQLREDEFTISLEGVIDRLSQFLRDPRVRRVVCAPSELNFDSIIDRGEILIVSLAGLEKPLVRFLGTILFHGLTATVFERPTWRRREVAVFVDEFQDYLGSVYATGVFQQLFTQGRRYKISLTVAHQDFGTVDARLLHSIYANAAAVCSFSCGPDEAHLMSKVFGAKFPPESIGTLLDHQVIARIGNNIVQFETRPPPSKVRDIIPDEGVLTRDDPPDPLEEFINRQTQRDPYRDARKPRRARPTIALEADLLG